MPVSALPSRTGVGELGAYAYEFVDALKENGVKIWQILPLNPVGYGNSPYQPYSSCAGDELYISLDLLYEGGLLKEKAPSFRENAKTIDYDAVRAFKEPYLKEAFANFQETEEYREFTRQTWVYEYAVFRALKKANGNACWNEWKAEDKDWPEVPAPLAKEQEDEAAYQMFLQYEFFTQWMAVKKHANENGIQIMGDVPFYVGVDSVDVWGGKDNFLLDTDGRPIFIAGVPPDYFSATGQRWGNPIYNWDYMKEHGYQFWTDRIGYNQKLFDIMYSNIDIPSADLMVARYDTGQQCGIALLKMNYKSSYTHMTNYTENGNCNDIIRQNAILPAENQKLAEACLIDLNDYSLRVMEKKYEVNGVKTNYFSQMFLQCHGSMSPKTELSIVTRAVEQVQKGYYDESEQWEAHMEAKSILSQELAEQGTIDIPTVAEKIFHEKPELKEEFTEKMENTIFQKNR